jgi:GTP cyclohydrolase II
VAHKRRGEAQADAYEAVGFKKDARDFAPAGKVLKDLGVDSVVMLTNNPQKVSTLIEQGVEVESTREIKL